MKKTSLLVMLLIAIISQAQTTSKLIGTRTDNYDLPSSSWQNPDSSRYLYDGHANDTAIYNYSLSASVWRVYSLYVKEYDAANNNTSTALLYTDTLTGARRGLQKMIYTYGPAGDTVSALLQQWDTNTANWSNFYRIFYFRDLANRDSFNLIQLFSNNIWKNYVSQSYLYGATGQLASVTVGQWNSSNQFQYTQRMRYSYSSNGQMAYAVKQTYDNNNSSWSSVFRFGYIWTGNLVTQRTYNTYDAGTSAWLNDSLITLGYDASGNLTSSVAQKYNTNTAAYDNIGQTAYTYNADNQVTSSESDIWVTNAWKYKYHYNYQYNGNKQIIYEYGQTASGTTGIYDPSYRKYYYYADVSTAIIDVKPAQSIAVYPNPATAGIELAVGVDHGQDLRINIYDINSRMVSAERWSVSAGAETVGVDISMLATGVYTISLTDEDGNRYMASKLVKQ